MSGRFFIDTNIFIYSFDSRDATKQKKALALIGRAFSENSGFISTQVVQEFLNVALRKFEKPLTIPECKTYLDRVLHPLCEVFPSREMYQLALDARAETGLGFYDALIVAAALQGNGKILYSEDFQSGRRIAGLTAQNPF